MMLVRVMMKRKKLILRGMLLGLSVAFYLFVGGCGVDEDVLFLEAQSSISEIEDFAFRNCKNLGSLEFLTKKYRDPVTAVEKGKAFEMMLAGKPAKIEYTDLLDCVPILANIGNYAFFGCLSLDVSSFKDSAERIGISAFDNCFSEIHSNNEPDIEAESESGMYSPEDDTYIENNDDIEIAPSDIESDEEDYSEDEIDEKEESGYEPQTDEVSTDDQNIAEPVEDNEEIREEFLVSGFIVVNNEIHVPGLGDAGDRIFGTK